MSAHKSWMHSEFLNNNTRQARIVSMYGAITYQIVSCVKELLACTLYIRVTNRKFSSPFWHFYNCYIRKIKFPFLTYVHKSSGVRFNTTMVFTLADNFCRHTIKAPSNINGVILGRLIVLFKHEKIKFNLLNIDIADLRNLIDWVGFRPPESLAQF